ncbi:TPA: ImmA/IrrE family metallo-endopeptidase, partial [Acinetobacter baumannii]|nr:ImmA/IrrE family metallo-endopeptidase [Acinetobacter baumannii]
MFNATRLDIARNTRGLTKRQLADKLNISERHLKNYENGTTSPDPLMIKKMSTELNFPEIFFYGDDLDAIPTAAVSFRSLSRLTSAKKRMALAHARLIQLLAEWIEQNFDLPAPDIPDAQEIMSGSPMTPESCAEYVRAQWGLGNEPIDHLIGLLEAKGILVFTFALNIRDVDACCLWNGKRPIIFLNISKTAERCRFDAAHELAHLVMHRHGPTFTEESSNENNIEKEANKFASSFLMPRESILALAPTMPDLSSIIKLKKYYNVSAAALAYRLNDLNLMTEWSYREINRQLSIRGKQNEPEPSDYEKSLLLSKIFSLLKSEGMNRYDLAKELQIL